MHRVAVAELPLPAKLPLPAELPFPFPLPTLLPLPFEEIPVAGGGVGVTCHSAGSAHGSAELHHHQLSIYRASMTLKIHHFWLPLRPFCKRDSW
jgi:hypothetical protein